MYTVLFTQEAKHDLTALDRPVAKRISQRLTWLGGHWEEIQPEALAGSKGEFFKFRVGDYRVLYEIVHTERALRVYRIRHRRDVYKEK